MTTDQGPGQPAGAGVPLQDSRPVLEAQSPEDTDLAWGEQPEPDDERLRQDRPPHWEWRQ